MEKLKKMTIEEMSLCHFRSNLKKVNDKLPGSIRLMLRDCSRMDEVAYILTFSMIFNPSLELAWLITTLDTCLCNISTN